MKETTVLKSVAEKLPDLRLTAPVATRVKVKKKEKPLWSISLLNDDGDCEDKPCRFLKSLDKHGFSGHERAIESSTEVIASYSGGVDAAGNPVTFLGLFEVL